MCGLVTNGNGGGEGPDGGSGTAYIRFTRAHSRKCADLWLAGLGLLQYGNWAEVVSSYNV